MNPNRNPTVLVVDVSEAGRGDQYRQPVRHLLTGLALIVATVGLTGCSVTAVHAVPAVVAAPKAMSCTELSQQAVRVSKDSTPYLAGVRTPTVLADNQKAPAKAGQKATLLMACHGTGVWSDGTRTPMTLQLTANAKGDRFVVYATEVKSPA